MPLEAVNGIFKPKFKIFRQIYRAFKHIMIDFSVAAFVNKYHLKYKIGKMLLKY